MAVAGVYGPACGACGGGDGARPSTVSTGLGADALEQPAQAGVELAVGDGAGEVAGKPVHPGEPVRGQAGEARLGHHRPGVGVAGQPRRLEGGEAKGVDQQDPEGLDRPLAIQPATLQQLEGDLAEPGPRWARARGGPGIWARAVDGPATAGGRRPSAGPGRLPSPRRPGRRRRCRPAGRRPRRRAGLPCAGSRCKGHWA